MRRNNLFADAAWAAVFAAWICDDNGYTESALKCRGLAIDLFYEARKHNQKFADSKEQEQVYLIDLYRRRAEFETALKICDEELNGEHTDHILDLLYYERELIDTRDSSAHNNTEAEDMIL